MPSMLPSLPKSFGRLSDVFVSALGSITGVNNRLGLRRVKNSCVILVDGLGHHNLHENSGYAKFLSRATGSKLSTVFPSTTAAAITSFATGVLPGQHGIVGYQIWDNRDSASVNLLTGMDSKAVSSWQRHETVSTQAKLADVKCYSIGPGEYATSSFTKATMPDATFIAAKSIEDRFAEAYKLLSSSQGNLVYVYAPELDQLAHAYGADSDRWRQKLEELDGLMNAFVSRVGNRSGVLLTADHGIIDVDESKHIYLDEFDQDLSGLKFVGGDPRVNFLYFEPDTDLNSVRDALQKSLDSRATVLTKEQVIEAGWYGEALPEFQSRLPDLFLLAGAKSAVYHRGFAKPKSLKMIGQHGGLSPEETAVPLLRFGQYL